MGVVFPALAATVTEINIVPVQLADRVQVAGCHLVLRVGNLDIPPDAPVCMCRQSQVSLDSESVRTKLKALSRSSVAQFKAAPRESLGCRDCISKSHMITYKVLIESAKLSNRGSIRRAWKVASWAGALMQLADAGMRNPSQIIKKWNTSQAIPTENQIQGSKRTALLNLLRLPVGIVETILLTIGAATLICVVV